MLALVPKCVACLAVYFGIGTVVGLNFGAPEICGATDGSALAVAWLLGGFAAATAAVVMWRTMICRPARTR